MTRILSFVSPLLLMVMLNIAHADVVVVVSKDNPVSELTQQQVERIFLGKLMQFPDGRSAIPLDMPHNAPVRDDFYERTTGKTDGQVRSYWSRLIFTGGGVPPKMAMSSADMLRLVADNPNTVGYVAAGEINDAVKVVWTPE